MKQDHSIQNQSFLIVPKAFLDEQSRKLDQVINLITDGQATGREDWIPEKEAQLLTGKKATTLWKYRKSDKVKWTKLGNKVFYSRESIIQLLNDNNRG